MVTKEFIKDLKKADGVVLRIDGNGNAKIELAQRKKVNAKGWEKPKARTDYNSFVGHVPEGKNGACCVVLYKDLSGFAVLPHIIRAGDQLRFRAHINNNGYLDHAIIPSTAWEGSDYRHPQYDNLYNEVVSCTVTRNERHVIRDLYIDSSIGPDNSARMIS